MRKKRKHLLSTFLKIGVTILLLYLIFTKISGKEISNILLQADKSLLTLALAYFIASQWVSSERLWILFRSQEYLISKRSNYQLYLIGMFYNFFIPGGIGGDAYKVFILHKKFGWSTKKLTATVFVDRFMGLTAIGILIVILCFFIPFNTMPWLPWVLPVLFLGGIGLSYLFIKKWFISFIKVFDKTLVQSIGVQLLQSASVILLLASISDIDQFITYVLVFLLSSVLSVFSFSGIGVREMIFYQAATLFAFDDTIAVSVGLLFSIITGFVSLFGVVFHIKPSSNYIKKTQQIH